ncbi:formylglycine-generating sulfatase enzyme family protein, partial [Chlamydia psittaci 02DC18]
IWQETSTSGVKIGIAMISMNFLLKNHTRLKALLKECTASCVGDAGKA